MNDFSDIPRLDEIDQQILEHLQRDSRMTMEALGSAVGASAATCWRRVKRLSDNGVIERYTIDIDYERAGQNFQAFLHIKLARHNRAHAERAVHMLDRYPEIVFAYAIAGTNDGVMLVSCRSKSDFYDFRSRLLADLPFVETTMTSVVLRRTK